jgi:hypothetical protein
MTRTSRFQPLTDLAGAVVFDRYERCEVGRFPTLAEAVKAARRMANEAAQVAAAETADRLHWRALTR